MVDLSKVWVELSVGASDLISIKDGQSIKIAGRGLVETANGKVVFVSPLIDKDTRTGRVVAELSNPDGLWRPGTFVTAGIALSEKVVAPASAIQKLNGKPVVFVRTTDGFERRDVVLGQKEDQMIEILEGLAAGETIASSNTFSLKAEFAKPRDQD